MSHYQPDGVSRESAKTGVGEGWYPLVDALYDHIEGDPQLKARVTVVQVKEKFGTLRFYVKHEIPGEPREGEERSPADVDYEVAVQELREHINAAQAMSAFRCEQCGKLGFTGNPNGHCLETVCPTHFEEAETRKPSWVAEDGE
jgi:hypothetical protein